MAEDLRKLVVGKHHMHLPGLCQEELRHAARRTETWFPTPEDRDAAERERAEYTPDPDQDDEDDE